VNNYFLKFAYLLFQLIHHNKNKFTIIKTNSPYENTTLSAKRRLNTLSKFF